MKKHTGWSDNQKKLAFAACRDAGMHGETRKLILRQLGGNALVNGEPSSTSPRLTHADFEKFMAYVESYRPNNQLLNYDPLHWQNKYDNGPQGRLLHRAIKLSQALADAGEPWVGIVNNAIGRDFEAVLGNLDKGELNKAIDAMTAVVKRRRGKGAA